MCVCMFALVCTMSFVSIQLYNGVNCCFFRFKVTKQAFNHVLQVIDTFPNESEMEEEKQQLNTV